MDTVEEPEDTSPIIKWKLEGRRTDRYDKQKKVLLETCWQLTYRAAREPAKHYHTAVGAPKCTVRNATSDRFRLQSIFRRERVQN
jgi:hypothetical protein